MVKPFWDYKITGDTKEHAARGTGPATDFATPEGVDIHAPFDGFVYPYETVPGGYSLELEGKEFLLCVQHLQAPPTRGDAKKGRVIALSGNTGKATTGPHAHAFIVVRKTGRRMSFTEWRNEYKPNLTLNNVKGGDTMDRWNIFRYPKTGDILMTTGTETLIPNRAQYERYWDIARLSGWTNFPNIKSEKNFFNLDDASYNAVIEAMPIRRLS